MTESAKMSVFSPYSRFPQVGKNKDKSHNCKELSSISRRLVESTRSEKGHTFCLLVRITGRQNGDRKEVFMERIKSILAPTDLSEMSQVGVRYALELARIQGVEVIVYHVANYMEAIPFQEINSPHVKSVKEFLDDRKKEVDHFLREAFPKLLSKVNILQEVGIGTPHESIVERAEKKDVDMIVMSTHGRTALAHIFIGSVTEQVVRRSFCPVLSIRPQAAATPAETRAV